MTTFNKNTRLMAMSRSITKVNEHTPFRKRKYWADQINTMAYPKNINVQAWWDAAWGKASEHELAIMEMWSLSQTLPSVNIPVVRSIGLIRKALSPGGFPKGKSMSPMNENITYWCYDVKNLNVLDRARVLTALTVKLPGDLAASPYECWESAWSKTLEQKTNLPTTAWEWFGPKIFDDSPTAIQLLCNNMPLKPIVESMLQINQDVKELPLIWHP